ncbi:MAG: PEP-CTERM sorting domain-containing protein [Planctomycetes bacterium]|nr:PEP-CTERM sorting domain-containing protein [Planctomycetota bacterium]
MKIAVGSTLAAQPRAIIEYAYESEAGVGIMAGVVPAPSTAALLALGAAGMAGRRRK